MKKIRLLACFCVTLLSFNVFSYVDLTEEVIPEKVLYSSYSSIPTFVSFKQGKELNLGKVTSFLAGYFEGKQILTLNLVSTDTDQLGMVHYRYQQMLDGIPVSYAYYVVHSRNNKVVSMNGLFFNGIESSTTNIDENQALKLALNYVSAKTYMWENQKEEQLLKRQTDDSKSSYFPVPQLIYFVNPSKLDESIKLGYRVTVYASQPFSKQDIYIDAISGKVNYAENLLHYKDVIGQVNTVYSGLQQITTDSSSTGYTLKESGRGNGIETYNMQNGTDFTSYVDFTNKNNKWDTVNAQKDQYAVDAHWGAEKTYDYYFSKHNRNSIDNKGYKLVNMVHYGSSFGNAYWDGTRMVYGDGDGVNTKNPIVSLDIIGHEITHGLTANTAKLILQNESGALNESFSDIFGATIDFYTRPDKANWKVGDECSSIYRSLEDPNSTNNPDTYQGKFWSVMNGADYGGIHNNNQVQNYWYYLLVQGGKGVNDNGESYEVTGIGIDKAIEIVYRNLTFYMTSLSNFQDARFYSIQAAIDLYGVCSPEVKSVTDAWYAVGVGSPYISKVTSNFNTSYSESCRAFNVRFFNLSQNATNYFWDFGDSTFSSLSNPQHFYTKPGKYTVKLLAKSTNGCGLVDSLIKTNLVEIHPFQLDPLNVEVCEKDSLIKLTSTLNSNVAWYANDTSSLILDTSKTFVFSNLKKDTSFFVGTLKPVIDSTLKVGETNVSSNISSYAATVRCQIFDVYKPLTIKSVLVNAYSAGDRVIELRDGAGNVLLSKTITIPVGVSRITLNFDVDPGIDYQLGLGGTLGNLGRSNAGLSYPYIIKDVISIKASNATNSAGLQYYYSFYDWEVVITNCGDNRQEYIIKQKDCSVSSLPSQDIKKVLVHPNPSSGIISISNLPFSELKVTDVLGHVIVPSTFVNQNYTMDLSAWETGVYFVEIKSEIDKEVIRVVRN